MTTLNFPSVLVPLVGLVFPAIAMASLFLHVTKKTRLFRAEGTKSHF
uniref:Photosystem I reaction center subunit VIII n=2 Tax=Chrysanthemum TaxID=13422 RepID=K9L538_CHRMO|nr:photosystem I subunit VIII [Chrysanthemum x morifolium]AEX99524.1 photosystem I subunit VIII [Chrysanthemum indicum]AFA45284.1 photosystem I subunit VIII [Chrysanthemum x morifolium]WEI33153.1 photosystem I subunit VIII [Chrysanthemum x morifolium]WEI33238.1 photosystem I subunit VIII [Chrysanthemum x morifolium]WEI33323.1 photosystem I subunit VIII [Chrysanthemum x morifolium]